jgi:hypothetical protein
MLADAMMSQLSTFGKTDLLQIRQLTDVLLGGNTSAETPVIDDNESLLFEAVKAELSSNGLNGNIPFATLKDSRYYSSWCKGLVVVNQFIDQQFKGYITGRAVRIGATRILVQILLADLKRLGVPPSLGTIARNLHRVPQAFDNQFPGYINSGLAYLVVKAISTKRK